MSLSFDRPPPEMRPHRRLNPLNGEWVLVSPQRTSRPWQGAQETPASTSLPPHDPACYLCPGNTRVTGAVNPPYSGVYVFDNDFPGLFPPNPHEATDQLGENAHPLLRREPEGGFCRVVCFSPRHDLTLPDLSPEGVRAVIDTWAAQCAELGARDDITYVQVFENKGEMMGCSNPHPHSQIWATAYLPSIPAREQVAQAAYLARHGVPLLVEYAQVEQKTVERILYQNDDWLVVVPYWAVWPFETLVLPRQRQIARLPDLSPGERDSLAAALLDLTRRYDRLFGVSFPYSAGIHQAPFDGAAHPEWQMHFHFYPPLLRSATVRKFQVGFEMLAMPQRDLTAEQAAARLRGA